MLRTADEMAAVVARKPFRPRPGNQVAAFFLDEPPPANLLETSATRSTTSAWRSGTREIYVALPERAGPVAAAHPGGRGRAPRAT